MLISTILYERKFALATIVVGIGVLAIAPRFIAEYTLISLITILMFTILTLSWTMFSGPTNYISLATAALFGVGVYATAVWRDSLPLPVIVLLGASISFALAFLIGLLTLRLKGVYFILFTFGVTALIRNVIQWWEVHVTHTVGRHVLGLDNATVYAYLLSIFAITLLVNFLLPYSSFGMALRGIGENDEAAEHIGIDVTRFKILTFACSALFMGASGAVWATRLRYVDPGIAFDPLLSFLPVLMAIFGGVARLEGPLLGAAIFTLLREFLITQYPKHFMLLMGLVLIGVILYLPGGLVVQAIRWWIWLKIQWAKTKFQWQMLQSRWRDEWRRKAVMWLSQVWLRMQWRLGRKRS